VQIKDALHQQFPQLEISGGNYPTAASKVFLSRILQVVQFSLIGVALAGDYLLTHVLNYPANGPFPPLYEPIREKKLFVGMGAWIVGNSVIQGLSSSGAFEIYYDGRIVSSKLNPASAAFASTHGGGGTGNAALPSLQFIIQQMHRIDPTLTSRRRVDYAQAGRSSPSQSPRKHGAPSPSARSTRDDDVNPDVRDLSYEDEL